MKYSIYDLVEIEISHKDQFSYLTLKRKQKKSFVRSYLIGRCSDGCFTSLSEQDQNDILEDIIDIDAYYTYTFQYMFLNLVSRNIAGITKSVIDKLTQVWNGKQIALKFWDQAFSLCFNSPQFYTGNGEVDASKALWIIYWFMKSENCRGELSAIKCLELWNETGWPSLQKIAGKIQKGELLKWVEKDFD